MENQPPFVEYPRPLSRLDPGEREPGVYLETIAEAWGLFVQDAAHWISATIVYFLLGWMLSLPVSILTQGMEIKRIGLDFFERILYVTGVQALLGVVPSAIHQILLVGMVAMGVRKLRGEPIHVGMIFEPYRNFGRLFLANGVYLLIVLASVFLFVVPSFFVAPVLLLMPTVAYLHRMNAGRALSETFRVCRRHAIALLGLCACMVLISLAGFCACLVGILVAWPLCVLVVAAHYRAFFEGTPGDFVAPGAA